MFLKIVKSWGVWVHRWIRLFLVLRRSLRCLSLVPFRGRIWLSRFLMNNGRRFVSRLSLLGPERRHRFVFSDELLNVCTWISSLKVSKTLKTLTLLWTVFAGRGVFLFNEYIRKFFAYFLFHELFYQGNNNEKTFHDSENKHNKNS